MAKVTLGYVALGHIDRAVSDPDNTCIALLERA
jgi:hypothetical protein